VSEELWMQVANLIVMVLGGLGLTRQNKSVGDGVVVALREEVGAIRDDVDELRADLKELREEFEEHKEQESHGVRSVQVG